MNDPINLLELLKKSIVKKQFIFFISHKHIEEIADLQVVHEVRFNDHVKWVYIGYNKKFELMAMDGQADDEMLMCEQGELEHLFRIRKLKKVMNKKKKTNNECD